MQSRLLSGLFIVCGRQYGTIRLPPRPSAVQPYLFLNTSPPHTQLLARHENMIMSRS